MKHSDFIHLVRLSEQDSASDERAYRRSVFWFAALGYLWVLGFVGVGLVLLWVLLAAIWSGRFHGGYVWLLVAAPSLLWAGLRALWLRLPPPQGLELAREDAPRLFELLDRIRKKVQGPPIHQVLLDGDFNACITQTPRFGLFGAARNTLTLGLPMLMALDTPRLCAVLAHEYGHLRGGHGRFAAWIYRSRLSWERLHASLEGNISFASVATDKFLDWYFPRFCAKTFAMAKQDEYEADRIAASLAGRGTAAAALMEFDVKASWLEMHFWPEHWSQAAAQPAPIGPYGAMRTMLAAPPPPEFAQMALRQALRRPPQPDDTHPSLRERIEALQKPVVLPAWSAKPALGLLREPGRWIELFDQQWRREHHQRWRSHHHHLARLAQRVQALQARQAQANADELTQLGLLLQRLNPRAQAAPLFEQALAATPNHAPALQALIASLPARDARTLALCERLWAVDAQHQWWASDRAVQWLQQALQEDAAHEAPLKLWRQRLKEAAAAETRAWQELHETPCFERIARHDLSDFELEQLRAQLRETAPIRAAWLVRKQLREFPRRRAYVLFTQAHDGLDEPECARLCDYLEQTLELPGPLLALWAGQSLELQEIERQAFEPIYRS
ncbi:MAG: M48 family metallopeptidase [Comamonadaceae bacterium]|nr:M48 family metallopeptidase [Comamonadaceae bacterium]